MQTMHMRCIRLTVIVMIYIADLRSTTYTQRTVISNTRARAALHTHMTGWLTIKHSAGLAASGRGTGKHLHMTDLGKPRWQVEFGKCPAQLLDSRRANLLNEWQSCCCKRKHTKESKVASQNKVDQILWQNFEGDEEAKKDCTADKRKLQSILAQRSNCKRA